MIQVNMLKQRPVVHGLPSEKEGAKLYVLLLVTVIFGALLAVGIYRVASSIKGSMQGPAQFANVETPSDVVEPSTGVLNDSVSNELVSETNSTRYENMGMVERFNYERVYSYYLFREITLVIPSDVDFSKIRMNNYSVVAGEGYVATLEGVQGLFSSLKSDAWDLTPRPASAFREFADGYEFRFEAGYTVSPLSMDSIVISESSIMTADHLQEMKDSVITVIEQSPVTFDGELAHLDSEPEGEYKNHYYTIEGRSGFLEFKDMLKRIMQLRQPISIKDAILTARDGNIDWVITLKVTVK